jgi:cobalt-zinc-cadmium efflux system outer membrane protein
MTWDQVRRRFEQNNPTLMAGQLNIDESKAMEITAFLRPNPSVSLTADQWNPFPGGPPHGCCGALLDVAAFSYLHEREHKRELRLESAKKGTAIAVSAQADLERTLLFGLRSAFVSALQAKTVLQLAKDDLAYWDHVLDISRTRFKAGDIAQIDLDRLELQRVTYESEVETADVNLRTSKIALLTLLNDRTPIDQYDVSGTFDFEELQKSQDEYRKIALENRPDLRAAVEAVDKAHTDHNLAVANGSTDPTFGVDVGRNPPIDQYVGASVSIPLRVFDRNQGEKLRTQEDITRNERLRDVAEAQVFSDVDSGYVTLESTVKLLTPYKAKYLQQSVRVRDTVWFSYQHGGAALLDFLNAESDYRLVQLNYANLVGSYLTAAAQLNMAVGREAIQ